MSATAERTMDEETDQRSQILHTGRGENKMVAGSEGKNEKDWVGVAQTMTSREKSEH